MTPPDDPRAWHACWTCGYSSDPPGEPPCLGCGGALWERTKWSARRPGEGPDYRQGVNSDASKYRQLELFQVKKDHKTEK